MKRLLKILVLFVSVYGLSFHTAEAHVLKSDGSIGVLLHVTPDDDPIVGEPAMFFFEVKDKQNKFSPQNCDCALTILKQDKQIFSTSLYSSSSGNDISSPMFSFTFPEKSVYSIVVTGKPKIADEFQAFSVKYDLRVSRDSGSASSSQLPLGKIILGIVIAAAIVCAALYFNKRK
ncbi:MAG TPA: hypothetical protein VGQ87_03445 [Patescibacteria group bacterium]|jgi:hypothetical protein|nr:hypothetical protein [Patescibacteria group bacterium]